MAKHKPSILEKIEHAGYALDQVGSKLSEFLEGALDRLLAIRGKVRVSVDCCDGWMMAFEKHEGVWGITVSKIAGDARLATTPIEHTQLDIKAAVIHYLPDLLDALHDKQLELIGVIDSALNSATNHERASAVARKPHG